MSTKSFRSGAIIALLGFLLFPPPLFAETEAETPTATEAELSDDDVSEPPFLEELLRNGFNLVPIDEEFAIRFGLPIDKGLLVAPEMSCASGQGSPQPWDIIVECNDQPIADFGQLNSIAENAPALNLVVFRRGQYATFTVPNQDLTTIRGVDYRLTAEKNEDVHMVYYMDGEKPWEKTFNRLEEGPGTIAGSVFVTGKPAEGLRISLLLAGNRRTQPTTVGADGAFKIHLPPGTYYYVGYALSGGMLPSRRLIPVDHSLAHDLDEPATLNGDEAMNKFEELSAKFGKEQAAQILAQESEDTLTYGDVYPLEVTASSTATVPDIIFSEPIRIVTPTHNSKVSLDQLQFAWVPYQGAVSYYVEICKVTRERSSTSYRLIVRDRVFENTLDAADVAFLDEQATTEEPEMAFRPQQRYALKVLAYNDKGKLLSASSKWESLEFVIK